MSEPRDDTESDAHADTSADRELNPPESGAGDDPSDHTHETSGDVAKAPRPARGGRLLGLFAVVLALGAGAAAGYVYYLTVVESPLAGIDDRLASERVARDDALSRQRKALTDAVSGVERKLAEQQQASEVALEALARGINEGMRLSPPSSREWKLAEVEYLLRIANHRLLMERDAAAASQLLAVADDVLAELDDYSLYPVRAQLAEERLALGNLEQIDIQGAFLRLEAVKSALDRLPLRLPEYVAERRNNPPEQEGERSFWQVLLQRLGSFVEFRRYPTDGVRPLLSPDEAGYLEMNLRLMLERTQLALLRRDAVLYQHSVAAALDWLDDYLDATSATVIEVRAELQSLQTLELERPLPDISGSLANLRSLARYGIEDDEASP